MNRFALHACAGVLVFVLGCGRTSPECSQGRYVPAEAKARAALEASLRDWQAGGATGQRIYELSDSYRTPDRPLKGFAILGSIPTPDARGFAVRLEFDRPSEEQVVRYLVVGDAPLWVFRQEDYERISHWEHKMEDEEPGPAPTAPAPHHPSAPAPGPPP